MFATILLYFLFGTGVAVALYVTDRHSTRLERGFIVLTALIFWPLYLPIILSTRSTPTSAPPPKQAVPKDDMARSIDQVDAELARALAGLEGWAEGALAGEAERIHELRNAWSALAERIREMDRLLDVPELAAAAPLPQEAGSAELSPGASERLRRSTEIRRQNLERLRKVRHRAYEDLMGTLAWVRELVSMIHLAKFTGAPASRARELVAQIAAAVEGLSAVRWEETPVESVGGNT
jgi:hypothetical protein